MIFCSMTRYIHVAEGVGIGQLGSDKQGRVTLKFLVRELGLIDGNTITTSSEEQVFTLRHDSQIVPPSCNRWADCDAVASEPLSSILDANHINANGAVWPLIIVHDVA